MAYSVEIESSLYRRRRYYQIKKPWVPPQLYLTSEEINVLYMCREFTAALLGRQLFEQSTRAIEKSLAYVDGDKELPSTSFATFKPGRIDYTPHGETIHRLTEAMKNHRVCLITYKSISAVEPKKICVSPLIMFSHNDALYINGLLASKSPKNSDRPEFDPILAVHRIQNVEITSTTFARPEKYDFEKQFNNRFGVMQDESFTVKAEFAKPVAEYVAERIWSPGQQITRLENGGLIITFNAASSREVIAKILSFGDHAQILEPAWLVDKLAGIVGQMAIKYEHPVQSTQQ